MGRSRHQLTIRVPIPTQLPAAAVLDALQLHTPIIRHQALVTRFQRRPVELAAIVDDSFFASDGRRISQFDVYERITLVPGVARKEISFPVVVQSTRDAVRCRADAPAGIRLWSEYRIERRRPAAAAADSSSSSTDAGSRRSGDGRAKKDWRGRRKQSQSQSPPQSRMDGEQGWPSAPPPPPPKDLASTNGYEGFDNGDELFELVEDVLVESNSMLMPFVSRSMESAHRELCLKVIHEVAENVMLQRGGGGGDGRPPVPRRNSN